MNFITYCKIILNFSWFIKHKYSFILELYALRVKFTEIYSSDYYIIHNVQVQIPHQLKFMDNVAIKSIYVSPLQGLNKQQEKIR